MPNKEYLDVPERGTVGGEWNPDSPGNGICIGKWVDRGNGILVFFGFLLDITDFLRQLLERVFVILVLDLQVCWSVSY